jgi:hypothetical protein
MAKTKKGGTKKKNKKGGTKKDYKSILDAVLSNTPAQQTVQPTFEEYYNQHPELGAEDLAQAENQVKPYIEQQIANELEDLQLWTQSATTDYTRSLRRARFTMANQGGGIGSERTGVEGEMNTDFQSALTQQQKGVARTIGTDRLTQAGYSNYTNKQEGTLQASQKSQIADWQQWYKSQRSNRYWGDMGNYYKQPTNTMLQ